MAADPAELWLKEDFSRISFPPITCADGTVATASKDKAEVFANIFVANLTLNVRHSIQVPSIPKVPHAVSEITFRTKAVRKVLQSLDIRCLKYFSPSNILTLYKAQIRPSLAYCSHIWGAAASTTLSILDAVQRRAIRLIGDPTLHFHLQPPSHRRAVGDLSLFYRLAIDFTRRCQSITELAPAQLKTHIKAAEVEFLLKLHKDKPMHRIFYKLLEEHGLSSLS
nr:unnamed protein product [Callosobruchus chinensis]